MSYHPSDPAVLADPYDAYRLLRDHAPVHRIEDPPSWVLSRFDDVWDAVRRHDDFSSARG